MASRQVEQQRERRKRRARAKIHGTPERPRLSVFRSTQHIYAQVIDDETGKTLAAAGSTGKDAGYGGNIKAATAIGEALATAAKAAGVTQVAFDRGHYKYHGRVKALADAVRAGGIQF